MPLKSTPRAMRSVQISIHILPRRKACTVFSRSFFVRSAWMASAKMPSKTSSPNSSLARSFDCTKISAGGLTFPSLTSCLKLKSFPSSCVMKTRRWSMSGAAAFTSPMLMWSGSWRIDLASSRTVGGSVAENMRVCRRSPFSPLGQWVRISSTCGAKPRSSSLSASSSTRCLVAAREMYLSRSIPARLIGVTTATSSFFICCAFSKDSRWSRHPVHDFPMVSFTNSSSVCLASSREGSMMRARANSFPGFPSNTSRGPRKAIVLPLPVGAEAST
mmetsp:Transcript_89068/g.252526  ORF Transcript_89068/g.252526 Transcript_89068/m.252526 type:complete len:274 (+) Transcript_89068:514-1335(+)